MLKAVRPDIQGATGALGADKAPKLGKMKVHEMHIRKGHEGGYIAKHHLRDEKGQPHPDNPEFPIADLKALHEHIDKHIGEESREISAERNKKPGMEELD